MLNALTEMLAHRAAAGQQGEPGFKWIGWTPTALIESPKTLIDVINED